jgi:2,3-bisphosphoglycerate-independent phosphoglycerate mutase
MKYAIVIPDGCADEPQESLGGRTPLQAASKPNMNQIAQTGGVGLTNNVPPSLTPASDVATLSLFGYDPLEVYTGRAPLEAAAMGISLGLYDWAVRCNLVTIERDEMRDFTAGHIGNEEGNTLIEAIQKELGGPIPGGGKIEFHTGVSYRNLMVYRGCEGSPFSSSTKTQAPHDIPDQPVGKHLPQGEGSELLRDLMNRSRLILADHPVNRERLRLGKRAATQIWLWGQGKAPKLRSFEDVYHKQGAIISAVDLVRGVGVLLGWKRIDVPGATGYLDTDYAAKGRAGVSTLQQTDLVCVHIEAPDEASHEGRAQAKVQALEEIDRHVVGPLLEALPEFGEWRILVAPDHRTPLRTRAHSHGAVPFAWAGTGIPNSAAGTYDEETAKTSGLAFAKGHELMESFMAKLSNTL